MTDSSGQGGFFSRWSKLKAEQRNTPSPQPVAPAPAVTADPMPAAATTTASAPPLASQQLCVPEAQAPSGPTLADVAELTPESDFRPFVARHVVPAVKNAAFKKLFADPHFNIMDGLDIYIDDYSQPSPLLPEDLQQMVAAKFMKLVQDDPPKTELAVTDTTDEQPKEPLQLDIEAKAAIKKTITP